MKSVIGKVLIVFHAFLYTGVAKLHADSYEKMWRQAVKYEEAGLPQSAFKVVGSIEQKAIKEAKRGQKIAAFLYGCKLRQQVTPDSFYTDILRLEQLKQQTNDEVERAIYASLLGELLSQNAHRNRNNSNKIDAQADSLKEWSYAQFMKEAMKNFDQSLSIPKLLAESKSSLYMPFVLRGDDAVYFNDDLLHVLTVRAVNGMGRYGLQSVDKKKAYYHAALSEYRRLDNREAELIFTLDSIDAITTAPSGLYLRTFGNNVPYEVEQSTYSSERYKAYINALNRFGDLPLAVEIYLRMVMLDVSINQKVKWINEGYARYADYPRIKKLLNLKKDLEQPTLCLDMPSVAYPNDSVVCVLTHRNVSTARLVWHRLPDTVTVATLDRERDGLNLSTYIKKCAKQINTCQFTWVVNEPHRETKDTVRLKVPGLGLYAVEVICEEMKHPQTELIKIVSISRLQPVVILGNDSNVICRVLDRMTGKPIENVTVRVARSEKLYMSGITDNEGLTKWSYLAPDAKRRYWSDLTVLKGDDRYLPPLSFGAAIYGYKEGTRKETVVRLYTDRSIYRPGQTVSVGGLCYTTEHWESVALADYPVRLTLRDANGREVAHEELKSDEMGKIVATFRLPTYGLSGTYSIVSERGHVSFKVEEYKRPTFEITMDELSETYLFGDTIRISGKARNYNGTPLRGARVVGVSSLGSRYFGENDGEYTEELDTVVTDDTGRFWLSVPIRAVKTNKGSMMSYQKVRVTITSISGESHDTYLNLPISDTGMFLSLTAPDKWLKSALPKVCAHAVNAQGERLRDSIVVRYALYAKSLSMVGEKPLIEGELLANDSVVMTTFESLLSGCYSLSVKAEYKSDTVSATRDFTLFDLNETHPADDSEFWFYTYQKQITPDLPGQVFVGTSLKDACVYCHIFDGEESADTVFWLSDSIVSLNYPYDKVKGDGVDIVCYLMNNGKLYQQRKQLLKKQPDKTLRLEWTSFRDRLLPGTKETWRLSVKTPDGKPATAQLMATLYDASLDAFAAHSWQWQQHFLWNVPHVFLRWQTNNYWSDNCLSESMKYYDVPSLSFSDFDERYTDWRNGVVAELYAGAQIGKISGNGLSLRSKSVDNVIGEAYTESDVLNGIHVTSKTPLGVKNERESLQQLRQNMNETVFFYPRLHTNKKGEVAIEFTLPDALTTWKFMALAHTKDMMTGGLSDEIIAAKEVMAQLRLPRFVRQGDIATLSAELSNLSDKILKGNLTMQVYDPMTDRVIWEKKMKMRLETATDTVVHFTYLPDGKISLPACRVWFEAGCYTDGEQRYLPVLENKEWLTQSLSFTVEGNGEQTYNLKNLFQHDHPNAINRRLIVEYTANPLWYAVQALPVLQEPRANDAISLASALNATATIAGLSARYPQLKQVVELWSLQEETQKGSLDSQQGLTGILLDEIPWVIAAENEKKRIQNIAQLFDENRQTDLLHRLDEALAKLQHPDGSFSWYESMRGNSYITMNVATLLLRGEHLNGLKEEFSSKLDVKLMLRYLFDEMGKNIAKDKAYLQQNGKRYYRGAYWLDYLNLCVDCNDSWLTDEIRSDIVYMLSCVEKDVHGLTLPNKATAAVVFSKLNKQKQAEELLRSLREYLVETSEGISLQYPSNSTYGYNEKMRTHMMIMEAFETIGTADKDLMSGMFRWLLGRKRLQDWGNPLITTMAVKTLLKASDDRCKMQINDELVVLSASGKELSRINTAESNRYALGYVKKAMEGGELAEGIAELKVSKQNKNAESWGAVYAQYSLPISDVTSVASGLRVRCDVTDDVLKVGDRIMLRYVITADKDYEYVRLQVGRAACLEPVEACSRYEYRNGIGYYKEVKDVSTNYYFECLPKGTYVIETECYVERPGVYNIGVAKLNGVYAPEFSAYSNSPKISVKP